MQTILCNIYSTVERAIADISDPRRHIYQDAMRRGKYTAKVGYIEAIDRPTILSILYKI